MLLRNEGNLLPLSKSVGAIAVIGPLAESKVDMLGSWAGKGDHAEAVSVLDGVRAGDAPKVLPATPSPFPPAARRPEKPDRTWTYLAGFMAVVGAFGFWWLNVFGIEDRVSRVLGAFVFGGIVFSLVQLYNPLYAYRRLIIAWFSLAGVGLLGRYVEALLKQFPILQNLSFKREYTPAEMAAWVFVLVALMIADYFSAKPKH